MFFHIIHRLVFIYKNRSVYFLKYNVSEAGFWLYLLVKPTQLSPIDRASPEIGTSSIDCAQLSEFYLKTETESSLRNIVLENKQDGF
jgi:hypothetical protein